MFFLRPVDGISVKVTPPGWRGYRLKAHRYTMSKLIKKVSAQSIKMVGLDPVHLPDQVLESRNYIWDVIPWTKGAWSHTLGPTTLTIPENAPEFP